MPLYDAETFKIVEKPVSVKGYITNIFEFINKGKTTIGYRVDIIKLNSSVIVSSDCLEKIEY